MDKGIIQSAREIFWSTNKKKLFITSNEGKGDISIANGMNGAVIQGYICKRCRKIILDY